MAQRDMDWKKLLVQLEIFLREAQQSDEDPVTFSIDKEAIELMLNIVTDASAGTRGIQVGKPPR